MSPIAVVSANGGEEFELVYQSNLEWKKNDLMLVLDGL